MAVPYLNFLQDLCGFIDLALSFSNFGKFKGKSSSLFFHVNLTSRSINEKKPRSTFPSVTSNNVEINSILLLYSMPSKKEIDFLTICLIASFKSPLLLANATMCSLRDLNSLHSKHISTNATKTLAVLKLSPPFSGECQ